jgi:acetyltransferase-like isoleucine patch superfamily enzyme
MNMRLRLIFLNLKDGIYVDKSCEIYSGAQIKIWKGGSISIGPHSEIMTGVLIFTYGGKIAIGEHCSINPYCIIYGHGGVEIGKNVLIAGHTMIIPNNHLFKDVTIPIVFQGNRSKGIIIEDDVWIGHGCSILDGVRIGKGSVIAAGSVVKDNVSPFSVIGGVPARLLKKRE